MRAEIVQSKQFSHIHHEQQRQHDVVQAVTYDHVLAKSVIVVTHRKRVIWERVPEDLPDL